MTFANKINHKLTLSIEIYKILNCSAIRAQLISAYILINSSVLYPPY